MCTCACARVCARAHMLLPPSHTLGDTTTCPNVPQTAPSSAVKRYRGQNTDQPVLDRTACSCHSMGLHVVLTQHMDTWAGPVTSILRTQVAILHAHAGSSGAQIKVFLSPCADPVARFHGFPGKQLDSRSFATTEPSEFEVSETRYHRNSVSGIWDIGRGQPVW